MVSLLVHQFIILRLFITLFLVSVCSIATASTISGKTIITKGKVFSVGIADTPSRILKRRSPVYDVDTVRTGSKSKAQLRMIDGGMIALTENTELVIASYEFDRDKHSGKVVMELLKGGLRSITGAIKSDYELKTPLGSMGIRGTHYEIEIVSGEVFIAVWDGAVDVSIDVAGAEQKVALGEGEDYAYAKIDETGEITELLVPPENFNQGYSSDPGTDEETPPAEDKQPEKGLPSAQEKQPNDASSLPPRPDSGDSKDAGPESGDQAKIVASAFQNEPGQDEPPSEPAVLSGNEFEEFSSANPQEFGSEDSLTNDNLEFFLEPTTNEIEAPANLPTIAELVHAKTGTVVFDQISDVNIISTTGAITNFQASMTIDFDKATVPTGDVSFNDAGGEWFAAYNGIINKEAFELDINFASHGNKPSDGDIGAVFVKDADHVLTNMNLFEKENAGINASGSFQSTNGNTAGN